MMTDRELQTLRNLGYDDVVDEIEALCISHRRYETVRRMTAQQFAAACEINIRTGTPFDQIIDDIEKK